MLYYHLIVNLVYIILKPISINNDSHCERIIKYLTVDFTYPILFTRS